jgi:hypothetical protein
MPAPQKYLSVVEQAGKPVLKEVQDVSISRNGLEYNPWCSHY